MGWLRSLIIGLVLVDAAYMTIDGSRALTRGDYFTASSGEHEGELGPWARILDRIGVEPRSTAMKTFFLVYGVAWLGVLIAFAFKQSWSWVAMLLFAVASLWYLTIGTVISLAVTIMLFVPDVHDVYRG